MQIGSTKKQNRCCDLIIDGWMEQNLTSEETLTTQIEDTYEGIKLLETSMGERYLGDIVSQDGKYDENSISIRHCLRYKCIISGNHGRK